MKVFAQVKKYHNAVYLYFAKRNEGSDKQVFELLKIGDSVFIEGGAGTGKISLLKSCKDKLQAQGQQVIFLDANLPVGDWVSDFKLFGKNLESRINKFVNSLQDRSFYLIVDNIEKASSGRKLDLILELINKARSSVFGCFSYNQIHPVIRSRLRHAKVYNLGSGLADSFDITYFVLAILLIFIAIIGAINLIFVIAALRYIFFGTRLGGRNI